MSYPHFQRDFVVWFMNKTGWYSQVYDSPGMATQVANQTNQIGHILADGPFVSGKRYVG